MSRVTPVYANQANPNDLLARVLEWYVQPGEPVAQDQPVCEIETAKVVVEVVSPVAGYVFPRVATGDSVAFDVVLAEISDTPERPEAPVAPSSTSPGPLVSEMARQTMAAFALSPADFPMLDAIRTTDVLALALERGSKSIDPRIERMTPRDGDILVYGTGSQAAHVLDAVETKGAGSIAAFLDYAPRAAGLKGIPIFHASNLAILHQRGARLLHICLPEVSREARIAHEADALGFELVNILHPSAVVSPRATLGRNVYLGPLTVTGPECELGDFCRLLNGASVAHHSRLGTGVRVSDGARVAGHVSIGANTLIGINATVNLRLAVGSGVVVVSGANVYRDVPDRTFVRPGDAYSSCGVVDLPSHPRRDVKDSRS